MSKTKKQLTKQQKIDLSRLGTGVRVEIAKLEKEGALNDPLRMAYFWFYFNLCTTDILRRAK
tara:strand:- start:2825 stop:3010 length:186 start_codon:yes stop_codon:yes gene_type:complete